MKQATKHDGKMWNELSFGQRHDLLLEDETKARAMMQERDEPWTVKAYGELSFNQRVAYAHADREAYNAARNAHEATLNDTDEDTAA